MKAISKKVTRNREHQIVTAAAETMLKIALLTADDVYGVDQESTNKFIAIYSELITEYGALKNGVELINEELALRGIDVFVKKARA
jgi:uncharacterized alkaline shock family protein YloU